MAAAAAEAAVGKLSLAPGRQLGGTLGRSFLDRGTAGDDAAGGPIEEEDSYEEERMREERESAKVGLFCLAGGVESGFHGTPWRFLAAVSDCL